MKHFSISRQDLFLLALLTTGGLSAQAQNVGIGTTAPTATLDVNGSARVRGLTVPGLVQTDASGNLSSASTTGFGTSFVLNQNAADQAANFRISGSGSTLGSFGVGTAAPSARLGVVGGGGFSVDLNVNGRLRTGDGGNQGGVWLNAATTQFVGQFDATTLGLYNGNDWRLAVTTTGNVGVGTTAPAYKLEVAGDINAVGQVRANGVVLTSDARFKQQVRPLGGALAAVQALRGVRYTWNALGIRHGGQAGAEQVGVLAQELEKVFPELVSTGADGYKAVNYAQLTPVLIEAIKEQQQQIEALQAQNAALQSHAAQAQADHASLQTLQAQMARLLGETAPAGPQARR